MVRSTKLRERPLGLYCVTLQALSLALVSAIAFFVVVHGRRRRQKSKQRPHAKRTVSAYTLTSLEEESPNVTSISMGCTQSTTSSSGTLTGVGADDTPAGVPDKTEPLTGVLSPKGKGCQATKKQVLDSVHDISVDEDTNEGKEVNKSGSGCVSRCDGRDSGRLATSFSLRGPFGNDKSSVTSQRTKNSCVPASDHLPADGRKKPSSDLPPPHPHPASSLNGPYKSSFDRIQQQQGSNRSSFAAEGLAPQGRGSASGIRLSAESSKGVGGGARASSAALTFPPSLEAARSSAQARMSSIAAADVMGVGLDKPMPALRANAAAYDPLPGFVPPSTLADAYPMLGALPTDTPVPLEVLQRLWKAGSAEEALRLARAFAAAGILRLAFLDDGSCWVLPGAPHVAHAAAVWPDLMAAVHGKLVDEYVRPGAGGLEALRDDGYIIQALSHHLVGSGRLAGLRQLLMNPGWLEAKLHAYGVGAVVRDFRRYLQEADPDTNAGARDVKLLLQAFQLSLGAAMEHPNVRMMREQMLARLMAVAAGGRLEEWFAEQTAKCAAESMLAASCRLLHLMPRSPSLVQAGGVQRMTLRGHTGPVTRVAIAPNCCEVVTISEDGSAQVWDMNIGDCVMHLARSAPLTALGVTPDSAAVVVAAADGTAAIWNLAAGQVTHTLKGHTGRINCLAVDKQGIRVVTGSEDRTARVWTVHSGECEAVLRGHGGASGLVGSVLDVAVCSDGTLAATASDDFSCRVWDLDEDGELLTRLEGHGGWVTAVAWIGTSHRLVTASHDATARLWDAMKGRCLFVLSGHSGRLNRVTVDPGGSWAITASDDKTARLWDCETGEAKMVFEGHGAYLADAAITRDGRKAITVSGDGTCAVWDLASGTRDTVLEGHTGEVACVALTQRGRFVVTAGEDCTARVWDLAAVSECPPPAPTHEGRVSALQALPDGRLVLSAGDDGCIMLWEPVEGTCLKRMEAHRSGVRFMRVSANGEHVLTGSGDRQISHWNWSDYSAAAAAMGTRRSLEHRELLLGTLTTTGGRGSTGAASVLQTMTGMGQVMAAAGDGGGGRADHGGGSGARSSEEEDPMAALAALKPPNSAPPCVSTSAIPKQLLSSPQTPSSPAGACGAAPCGPVASCRSLLEAMAALPADPLRASMPAQQGSRVKHMAFDGSCRTAAVLLYDSTVSVWDVDSGRCVSQLIRRGERDASRTHSGGVNVVLLTRDGRTAVTISKDSTARVWDVATATTRYVVEGHTDSLVAADLSPDEGLLATASYDRTVRVSRLSTGAAVAVLDHPQPPVWLAFSPDSRWMAVGLEDHAVVVWDLVERCCLPSLDAHKAALSAPAWSPDSRFLATAAADCTLRLWRVADGRQQAFFMGDGALTAVCFAGHPLADIVVAGDAAGAVHFLDFGEEIQG